jgi:hypothetical protein
MNAKPLIKGVKNGTFGRDYFKLLALQKKVRRRVANFSIFAKKKKDPEEKK